MTRRVAAIFPGRAGVGGLGAQAANALSALVAEDVEVHAYSTGGGERWRDALGTGRAPTWHVAPPLVPSWYLRYTWMRWYTGQYVLRANRALGAWAAGEVARLRPERCYAITEVALETLRWARGAGVPTVLDCATGHIRNFSDVLQRESRRWCGGAWTGHPSSGMVERESEEYALADRIVVNGDWAKESLVAHGVAASKIHVLSQYVDTEHFQPRARWVPDEGPLKLCFVGSIDLRKGFVYLLQAMRAFGAERVTLEMVGATGDRCSRLLLERESAGLRVTHAPGDPRLVLARSELLVVPSVEDGLPYAATEGMAAGVPIVITDQCGASSWVEHGRSGWVVPAADPSALAAVFADALARRAELPSIGRAVRESAERRGGPESLRRYARLLYQRD